VANSTSTQADNFLEQIAKTPERTRFARLKRIRDALRAAVPQLAEIELVRDNRGTPHLRGKYEHWRPQGAWQTEEQFSDGTLRLMGLLWVAMEGGGPLLRPVFRHAPLHGIAAAARGLHEVDCTPQTIGALCRDFRIVGNVNSGGMMIAPAVDLFAAKGPQNIRIAGLKRLAGPC
jgi:hypothetical protein